MSDNLIIAIISFFGSLIGAVIVSIVTVRTVIKSAQLSKATRLSELLSFWVIANPKDFATDAQKMTQYSYEMGLILPKKNYEALAKRLMNAPDALSIKEILIQNRELFGNNDGLKADAIIHW